MQDLAQYFYYVKGALKYKWIALIITWIFCLAGWSLIFTMPNKYLSEAKVHVETKTMLQPLLRGMTIQSDTVGLLRIMQVLMFTRSNIEQIIKLSDLDKVSSEIDKTALIDKLKTEIKISGGADDVFTIKYEATSPTVAKNVVQSVLTVFSEQTHQSTLAGTDVAKKFIEDQIQEYETRLRNAEKAKENFKRANLGLLPGEGGEGIGQIQAASTQLEEAELALNTIMSRRDALLAQMNEVKESKQSWEVNDVNQKLTEKDALIESLITRKRELLMRFTENHPEVMSINRILDAEKQKQDAEMEAMSPTDGSVVTPKTMANPYIQTIKVALNENDAEIASQKAKVNQLKARIEKMKDELNMRLSVETELQNLNRDYDSTKKSYEQLLESREQAAMSEKVDDQAEALKFKIADAPNTPLTPSSPKRAIFYSMLLVVGSVAGFAMSLLLYMVKPTVMSTLQLGQLTGLPVLGSISIKHNPIDVAKNKRDMIRYYAATAGLILVYSAFMGVEIAGIDMIGILKSL
jgi:polysaccharide chain length determinant protein (PEP-CTERM system associated)